MTQASERGGGGAVDTEMQAEVLIVGGGLGGVAAALAACRNGRRVVMTEEVAWLGGQLTAQGVPPDEHPWIEQFGATRSYHSLREGVRDRYRRLYPLTDAARRSPALNPGGGLVSKLCAEPRQFHEALQDLLAPHRASGRLSVLHGLRPTAAQVQGDVVTAVTLTGADGRTVTVTARYVIDATETGELLPLTGTEFVTGFESQAETGEPSAPPQVQPANVQAASVCFAIEHRAGEDHTIDPPWDYARWRDAQPSFWPDRQLSLTSPHPQTLDPHHHTFAPNPDDDPTAITADQSKDGGSSDLWVFRRILARRAFTQGFRDSDIVLVNWPMIDYLGGTLYEIPGHDDPSSPAEHLAAATRQSLSLLHWLQTEAPRSDGGTGHPGLRLVPEVMGTSTGLAMQPYHREGRRIRAVTTVVEQDLSLAARGDRLGVRYRDTVGVGMYRIDLHPSTGGDNYIDVGAVPYHVPLGALIPRRVRNLLAGGKNMGTTHITNGCYRLHPTEWTVGEVAGLLAHHCLATDTEPQQVQADDVHLHTFASLLDREGIERAWPQVRGY